MNIIKKMFHKRIQSKSNVALEVATLYGSAPFENIFFDKCDWKIRCQECLEGNGFRFVEMK